MQPNVKAARNAPCPCGSGTWQLLGIALGAQRKEALAALTQAARCLPDDAVAHHNLGTALARLGRLEEAEACFRRALFIRPAFAQAHVNLAELQLELGQPDAAATSCRRALESDARSAAAHQALGNALLKLARRDEAMASLRLALDINPALIEARLNLANALRGTGRLEEAAAGYRQTLDGNPDYIPALVELGSTLRLQGRGEESSSICRRALTLEPNAAAALAVLAELEADAGRFAQAEEIFKKVIAIDPESAEGWVGIARLRRMTGADRDWLAAAQRLADRGPGTQREMSLRFAIVKYFDDLQNFDDAFRHYRRANELAKRFGPAYDGAFMSSTVDRIMHSFDGHWIGEMRRAAHPSTRPVFIVGMLRSGTTLVEQILASHPAVFGAGELPFWGDVPRRAQGG